MHAMNGQRSLITGAASPIGLELVRAFVDRGATVIAVDSDEEKLEVAVAALGLADSEDVITRGLDASGLGSWWDLANLVTAFYYELDVFIHVSQGPAQDSLALAIDRLGQSLRNAEATNPEAVRIVVVASDAGPAADQARHALAAAGSAIPVAGLEPGSAPEVCKRVLQIVSTPFAEGVGHE